MFNDFFAWRLAEEHRCELLEEAEISRLLKGDRPDKSKSLKQKLLVALCCAVPVAALIVGVAAAATIPGGSLVHLLK